MRKYFYFYKSLLAVLFLTAFLLAPAIVRLQADTTTGGAAALNGLNTTANAGYGSTYVSNQSSFNIYKQAGVYVGILLSLIGVFFLGLMIYAGFTWMMARGNAEEAKKSLQMINDAMIGLIIILGAYALTRFIGNIFVNK